MFDLFKKSSEAPRDVKGVRDTLLRFIKEELQKLEGGEGRHIKALQLFIAPSETEKHIYESAVYFEENSLLKSEIQKIADDFAIDLPGTWLLECTFADTFPAEALKVRDLDAALFIQTRKHSIRKTSTAYVRILNGEAEKDEYTLTSESGKVTIGREKKVQVEGGFFRMNTIAFSGESTDASTRFISRQHAHIEWNENSSCFMLFADEGGIPPGNKVKVRTAYSDAPERLNSTQIGHRLQEGDQIILGDSAILLFSFLQEQQ